MKKIIISVFVVMYAVNMQAATLYKGMFFLPESSDENYRYAMMIDLAEGVSGEIVIPERFTLGPDTDAGRELGPPYDWIITRLGVELFKRKTNITAVVIPKSITVINAQCFRGCSKLTDLYVSWDDFSGIVMGQDVFLELDKAAVTLHVPVGKKAAYQASAASSHQWSGFNIVDDGATIIIDPEEKTTHYVKTNGTGDGSSWNNAAGNIQEMIDKAAIGDDIWVAKGTYCPTRQTEAEDVRSKTFRLRSGVHLYGGFAGNEAGLSERATSDKDSNGRIEPWEFTNETILSGDIDGVDGKEGNSYRVVACPVEFSTETLFNGFTVKEGGINYGTSEAASDGGGICAYGKLTVSQCIVKDNAARRGSGIANNGGTVEKSLIENNVYEAEMGGLITGGISGSGSGIYNYLGTIKNCIIRNNRLSVGNYSTGATGASAEGAGIYNSDGIVSNCLIYDNSAWASSSSGTISYCGGIYNSYGVIYNSTIVNNIGSSNISNLTNSGSGLVYNTIYEQLLHNFVNPEANDFRLKSGSQYLDAGSTENIPDWIINGTDLAGNPRIHNGKIDMGAYEYSGDETSIHQLPSLLLSIYPNPANESITISGLQGNETLYFYNISGNRLLSRQATGETETVSVAHLPAGVYFVKTNNGQVLKWMKK